MMPNCATRWSSSLPCMKNSTRSRSIAAARECRPPTIGSYTFRPSSKILLNQKGNKVRLTEKETAILRYLYRADQRPVSRETLLQEVWGYNSGVTTHTLETHIYRLRQKFENDAATPAILVTEAGGYKLVP